MDAHRMQLKRFAASVLFGTSAIVMVFATTAGCGNKGACAMPDPLKTDECKDKPDAKGCELDYCNEKISKDGCESDKVSKYHSGKTCADLGYKEKFGSVEGGYKK